MYRVQYKNPKEWGFVCKECLISVKKDNPNYTYGGTWKGLCNLLQFKSNLDEFTKVTPKTIYIR